MNCNEARRLITAYVKKELPDRELEQFLYHVEHCSDCMDELNTYYTVYQALDLLDFRECHDYNFQTMLERDIKETRKSMLRRKMMGVILAAVLLLTEVLLGISVYTGYELERGNEQSTLIERAILYMNLYPVNGNETGNEKNSLKENWKEELIIKNGPPQVKHGKNVP